MSSRTSTFLLAVAILILAGGIYWYSSNTNTDPSEIQRTGIAVKPADNSEVDGYLDPQLFIDVTSNQPITRRAALNTISDNWRPEYAVMMVEAYRRGGSITVAEEIVSVLNKRTRQNLPLNMNTWYAYIWKAQPGTPPNYAEFKARFYEKIDERFAEYFDGDPKHEIGLEEVVWGGVQRDGIPPLKDPKMISVEEATFMGDSNVVFGVNINGDTRAYPKRILAHHEMFKDTIGGVSVCGVYCTLCGSLIIYDTKVDGKHYELGTSGFLYKSNKLMYDHETKSMWSTLDGKPVVGKLVGSGIRLKPLHVVTTTWGKWRDLHPETTVLSQDTGHSRDYSEGAAYKHYFETDQLMFVVPETDSRLKNKAEILALRGKSNERLAIDAEFLATKPIHHDKIGDQEIVVITDSSGANRVYSTGGVSFEKVDGDRAIVDSDGTTWTISEAELKSDDGKSLKRFPAHRAFWFGWFSAFPDTRLVTFPTKSE